MTTCHERDILTQRGCNMGHDDAGQDRQAQLTARLMDGERVLCGGCA